LEEHQHQKDFGCGLGDEFFGSRKKKRPVQNYLRWKKVTRTYGKTGQSAKLQANSEAAKKKEKEGVRKKQRSASQAWQGTVFWANRRDGNKT